MNRDITAKIKTASAYIKVASVFAFISAGLTVLAILFNLVDGMNAWSFIDVGITVILGVLLLKLNSRLAALLLLAFFLYNKVAFVMIYGLAPSFTTYIFLVAFFFGLIGAYNYQRLKREMQTGGNPPKTP